MPQQAFNPSLLGAIDPIKNNSGGEARSSNKIHHIIEFQQIWVSLLFYCHLGSNTLE
ncbi:hypothetical protein ACU8KH_00024 [Lachancea thermotolerans]